LWLALVGLACDTASDRGGRWQYSCGDPVCHGYQKPAGVALCTSEKAGDSCPVLDERCDPVDDCNRILFCSIDPPPPIPCPISRRSAKRDIRYLTSEEVGRYARDLEAIRLATYRYREASPSSPVRLGFVIEDGPPSPALDAAGDHVDLYGYTSLAVAALQAQAAQIAELRREVASLRRALEAERGALR
jgi:hypothetical protein